jgi:hypothetical protein
MPGFLEELFGAPRPQAEVEAVMAQAILAEKARVAAVKAEMAQKAARPPCPRCLGAGKIGAFLHVAGGVCFQCNGEGY